MPSLFEDLSARYDLILLYIFRCESVERACWVSAVIRDAEAPFLSFSWSSSSEYSIWFLLF